MEREKEERCQEVKHRGRKNKTKQKEEGKYE